MDKNDVNLAAISSSITFSSFLGLVFIALRLADIIKWSWWWVLAPFWMPPLFAGVFLFFLFMIIIVVDRIRTHKKKAYISKDVVDT